MNQNNDFYKNGFLFLFCFFALLTSCQNKLQSIDSLSQLETKLNEAPNNEIKHSFSEATLIEVESQENEFDDQVLQLEEELNHFGEIDLEKKSIDNKTNFIPIINQSIDRIVTFGSQLRITLEFSQMKIQLIKMKLDPAEKNYESILKKLTSAEEKINNANKKLDLAKNKITGAFDRALQFIEKRTNKLNPLNPLHIALFLGANYLKKEIQTMKDKFSSI